MNLKPGLMLALAFFVWLPCSSAFSQEQIVIRFEGTAHVKFWNYENCVELKNISTRVVLGHHLGGRLLAYELDGNSVIYVNEKEANWDSAKPAEKPIVSAGRFDLGPEIFQARGTALWSGPWTANIVGDRTATMTSGVDPESGLQVVREFTLSADSSRLTVTQSVTNTSDKVVRQCYWSRTFAEHGGVAIVPCDSDVSRFPNLYSMSQARYLVDFKPEDPAVRCVGDFLAIDGPTQYPKLGFDSTKSWVAYQTRDDQLFVKRYRVYPDRSYGEANRMNLSIYYPEKDRLAACEIEPIGPLEIMKPGDTASFTVDWWLLDRKFPKSGVVDPLAVASDVEKRCVLK